MASVLASGVPVPVLASDRVQLRSSEFLCGQLFLTRSPSRSVRKRFDCRGPRFGSADPTNPTQALAHATAAHNKATTHTAVPVQRMRVRPARGGCCPSCVHGSSMLSCKRHQCIITGDAVADAQWYRHRYRPAPGTVQGHHGRLDLEARRKMPLTFVSLSHLKTSSRGRVRWRGDQSLCYNYVAIIPYASL